MKYKHNSNPGDEDKQAELEPLSLQHAEEKLATIPVVTSAAMDVLLGFSPDALIIVKHEGTVLRVNEQAARLFGYRADELPGQPLESLLPERLRALHTAHRIGYTTQPRQRPMGAGLDLLGLRKDGSEFPIDISLRPVLLEEHVHIIAAIRDVTTQRLLERERARQAERISLQATLINLAHDAILVRDPISRILFWNRGAEELYGWTEQEALGRVTHTLLKTRFPISLAAIDAQLEKEGQWEGTLTHTRRDGRTVVVEGRQVLVRDEQGMPSAVLEINRDITKRRQLEHAQSAAHAEALAQSTFLQELLDALPSSVYVVHGKDARLILANREATRIWGAEWRPEQPLAEFLQEHHIRITDLQGRPFPPEAWATTRALLNDETVLQHQEMIRQPTGNSLPILVNAVPLTSPYWQRLHIQKSQEKSQHTPKSEPLALVIHQDVRLLKETEYIKDEFISIAAHELRLPLAVLKGVVGTLVFQTARGRGTPLADWQLEMLQELEQATDRLSELTQDLLDVSRLQAGQLLLQRTSTNIVTLTRRVVDHLQRTTTRHQLEFQASQTMLEIMIDPGRIEQVLTNLLTNAIKYSPHGGAIKVMLETGVSTQTIEIRVEDHGIGIPLHQQARIFGRFVRAENAQTAGINGTGLGLYLSRALVEQHEGQLWFASTEGVGTTFFLTLPHFGGTSAEE